VRTERIVFEKVSIKAKKTVKCAGGCGRSRRLTKEFMQTINPFNKTKAGVVKTHDDIYPELQAAADKWKEQSETCLHCRITASKESKRLRS
jgi:hypothetical protein